MKGLVMKRGVVEKGHAQRVADEHAVNHVQWARQAAGGPDCQNRVDVKALTGRGNLAHLRHQVASLDSLDQQMRELAQKSKNVAGLGIYLVVHQRSASGYVFLRWRARCGANRHLSWDEVDQMDHLSAELRQWCRAASTRAQELNAKHLDTREAIKRIRLNVARTEPFMYPRSPFPSV